MYKLIMSGSYDFGEPPLSLVDIHSRGIDKSWMQKRAAVFTRELSEIRPKPGKAFIHLIALGDSEAYGANRNGDGFTKRANVDRHHTFVDNGHLFRNHQNKDPEKALGKVAHSVHNDPMGRVELIVEADEEKCADEIEKVAREDPEAMQGVSMACKVAYDVCTICNNKASSRQDYCKHARDMMGQILDDGRRVYVDNPNPTYFDISFVVKNADRIAYGLRKVASGARLSGAELAELYDYLPAVNGSLIPSGPPSAIRLKKLAIVRKLSEIEKQIDGAVTGVDFNGQGQRLIKLRGIFGKDVGACPLTPAESEKLARALSNRPGYVLAALARQKISLPVETFLKLSGQADADVDSVKSYLPGIFTRLIKTGEAKEVAGDGAYDLGGTLAGLPEEVKQLVGKMVPELSLDEQPVQRRVTIISIRKLPTPELTEPSRIRTIKSAAAEEASEALAKEYAKYKLSLLTELSDRGDSALDVGLGVLQDYV